MRGTALVVWFVVAACERQAPAPAVELGVNDNTVVPRTVLAATRGGDAIDLVISSVPGRTCDEMFGTHGASLGAQEVLVTLTLGRPLVPHGAWGVLHAAWPGGSGGAGSASSIVEMPADLASHGGKLRVRYDAKFELGAASPRSKLALDAHLDVKPCGDRPLDPLPAAQPAVRIAERSLPIRTVLVVPTSKGQRIILSTGTRTCPQHHSYTGSADLQIELVNEGDRVTRLSTSGDLVPVQLGAGSVAYRVVPTPGWTGDGPLALQIDSTSDDERFAPISIHGQYAAQRCPSDGD
jgi:hypothetical protein